MTKSFIVAVSGDVCQEHPEKMALISTAPLFVIEKDQNYRSFVDKIVADLKNPEIEEVVVSMIAHGVNSLSDNSDLRGNVLLYNRINIHPSKIIQDIEEVFEGELSNKLKFNLFACSSGRNIKELSLPEDIEESRTQRYTRQLPLGSELTIHAGHFRTNVLNAFKRANQLTIEQKPHLEILEAITEAETSKIIFNKDGRLEVFVRSAPKFTASTEDVISDGFARDASNEGIREFLENEAKRYLNFLHKHHKINDVEHSTLLQGCKSCITPKVVEQYIKDSVFLELFRGKTAYVDQYLKDGFDVDLPLTDAGATALYIAIALNNLNMVKEIIKYAPDPDFTTKSGDNYFSLAIKKGNASIVKCLLGSGGFEINKPSASGETPLCLAVREKNLALVKLLLENGANPNEFDSPSPITEAFIVDLAERSDLDKEILKTVLLYTGTDHFSNEFHEFCIENGLEEIVVIKKDEALVMSAELNKQHNELFSDEYLKIFFCRFESQSLLFLSSISLDRSELDAELISSPSASSSKLKTAETLLVTSEKFIP